jgi:AraC family transcriptional regulator
MGGVLTRDVSVPASGTGVDRTFFDREAVSVVRDSLTLGWEGVYAAVTEERPYETKRPQLRALWLAASLSDVSLRRFVRGREYYSPIIPPDTLTVTPPGEEARDVIGVRARALHLFISPDLVQEVADELSDGGLTGFELVPVFSADDPALMPILRVLKQAMLDPQREGLLRVDYLARALAAHLLMRHSANTDLAACVRASPALTPRQLQTLRDFIALNLAGDISIADLAALVGLSRARFLRRFKASTGSSPYRSVMAARVQCAKALLIGTDLSLADVAARSGFASQTHLATAFVRFEQVSPSAFRRQSR